MTYDFGPTQECYPFVFAMPDDLELCTLREQYGLESLIAGSQNELEKLGRICAWAHSRWQHDGLNEPSKPDALTILKEAGQGRSFRCVEYGIVISACAAALGLPSRVLWLKTEDSETREFGASHVVGEVFLPDLKRWVLADGQFNVVLLQDGEPLSGMGLRQAIDSGASITSANVPEAEVTDYLAWVDEYLFCFVTALDTRSFGLFSGDKLALLPSGAPEPTVFQRRFPVTETTYTRSVTAFYPVL